MRAMVIGNGDWTTTRVREMLVRSGYDCEESDVAPLESAAGSLGAARRELVALVVTSDTASALKAVNEIRSVSLVPLLVVGPTNDPRFLLSSLRSGADEYLDQDELEMDLDATLARLRNKRPPEDSRGTVVAVLGASGGCGTSTVAVNLAAALARQHERTALFDLRLEAADQTLLLDAKPTHTLADLCRNLARMDSSMFHQALVRHPSGIHLLAAPGSHSEARHVSPQGVQKALAFACTQFPFVICDMERYSDPEQTVAVVQSDLVLLISRLDIVSLNGVRRTTAVLRECGIPENRIQVVVNRHRQPRELTAREAEQALGIKIAHYVPDDPSRVNSSVNKGDPVVCDRPRSGVSASFARLANRIIEFHRRHEQNGRHREGGHLLYQTAATTVI